MHDEQTLTTIATQAAEIAALKAVNPLIRELTSNTTQMAANMHLLERLESKIDESIGDSKMHLERFKGIEEKGRDHEKRLSSVEVSCTTLPSLVQKCEEHDRRIKVLESLSQKEQEEIISDRREMLKAMDESSRVDRVIDADNKRGRIGFLVTAFVAVSGGLAAGIKFLWDHLFR